LISILVLQLTSVSAALLVTPTGFVEGPSPLQQVFLPGRRFHRFSAFNLLPELDQVKLGIFLGPALGLLQSREEGRRLGEVLLPLNRAAENRSEYRQMGSVAGWTLAEIWGGAFDAGHLYQYVPPHRSDEHLPVLVVLHGYGGNSKTYPVVFEGFGAGNRFIVLCPSYGFGIYREGWVEAMDRVRSYAVDHLSADPGRIFLLGYSNGGIGAFKAVAAHPEHYAGMILVSAVFRPDLFTPEVRAAWGERPILCLSGGRDTRISPEYSSARIQELRASGLKIAWDAYSDEDHFMLFASREAVVHRISAWLEEEQLK
jgi:predicted esterase